MEELAAADPNRTDFQFELALSYDNLAIILTELKRNHSEALVLYRKSQKIGNTLLSADPLNTKLRRGQAVGDFNVAQVSAKLGDIKTGLESARKALATMKSILVADPKNDDFIQAVAMTQGFVCEMMIKNGNAAEAIALLTESLTPLQKSYDASPSDR